MHGYSLNIQYTRRLSRAQKNIYFRCQRILLENSIEQIEQARELRTTKNASVRDQNVGRPAVLFAVGRRFDRELVLNNFEKKKLYKNKQKLFINAQTLTTKPYTSCHSYNRFRFLKDFLLLLLLFFYFRRLPVE